MKNIIVATFTLLFVFTFSTELSYSQISTQLINKPIESVSIHNPPVIPLKIEKENYIIMRASAYTKSVEEGTSRGITRCGTKVNRGTVSVDPRIIPLKTKLYIEGYGEATALDTGGAIKGNRIDLYMETKKEALEWGLKEVKVFILE